MMTDQQPGESIFNLVICVDLLLRDYSWQLEYEASYHHGRYLSEGAYGATLTGT